ncbi:helix-turn-helix domain-containing protein [Paraburkholderia sp. SIMBA_030]|uniref:HVO_A0114 family putative DNA-binding protein n=1 Tax=Paraburkholderia sp. SIMBA_030 TaxID=3085773 RepID=UPI00397D248E
MNIVTVGVASRAEVAARFIAAMQDNAQGAHVSFASSRRLFQTLTGPRCELLRALMGRGPVTVRQVAQRLQRDIRAVHRDVQILLRSGLLERTDDGAIVFPHDAIHVDFTLTRHRGERP